MTSRQATRRTPEESPPHSVTESPTWLTSSRSTKAPPVRAPSCSITTARIVAVAQQEFRQIFPQPGWVEHDPNEIWATQIAVAAEALGTRTAAPARRRRHRHHQPARDDRRLGPRDRRADPQRHRLAGPPHRGVLRPPEARRPRGAHPRQHRPGHRRLLLRHQGRLAARQRPRRPSQGRRRRAGLRHHRHLADLEADRRHAAHHRRQQRLAHAALQHPHRRVGRRTARAARRAAQHAARGALVERGLRPSHDHARPRRRRRSPASPAISRRRSSARLCFEPGLAKNTYGTGCFMLLNTGAKPWRRRTGCSRPSPGRSAAGPTYALEGSVFIGGAVVQWLRDGLGHHPPAAEVEALAASVPDSGGVYLVPAFAGSARRTGTRTPAARSSASRAARPPRTSPARRWKASRFRSADLLDAMRADAGIAARPSCASTAAPSRTTCYAVPGRPARRAGRAAEGHRDHGARRRLSRRAGGRLLEDADRDRGATGKSTDASSRRCRRTESRALRASWREALGALEELGRPGRSMNRPDMLARLRRSPRAVGHRRHRRRRDRRRRRRRCGQRAATTCCCSSSTTSARARRAAAPSSSTAASATSNRATSRW